MSNATGQVIWCAVVLGQAAAAAWVIVRRRGMWPVLLVNLVCAAAVLIFVLPYLPGEVAYFREEPTSDPFDYKNSILTVFEAITVSASAFAFFGFIAGKIVAWIGFAGNFVLGIVAALFFLTFEFKCCGYL